MKVYEEVKVVKVSLFCDKCEVEAEIAGPIIDSNPPQHLYICPKCGTNVGEFEEFPKYEYQLRDDLELEVDNIGEASYENAIIFNCIVDKDWNKRVFLKIHKNIAREAIEQALFR